MGKKYNKGERKLIEEMEKNYNNILKYKLLECIDLFGISLHYSIDFFFHLGSILTLENVNPKTEIIRNDIKKLRASLDDIVVDMKLKGKLPKDYSVEELEKSIRKEFNIKEDEPYSIPDALRYAKSIFPSTYGTGISREEQDMLDSHHFSE